MAFAVSAEWDSAPVRACLVTGSSLSLEELYCGGAVISVGVLCLHQSRIRKKRKPATN